MDGVYLHATSLGSKFGFADGDLLSDVLLDELGFDRWKSCRPHEILVGLVRDRLLPLLPDVEVFEIETCHNPIRATDEWAEFCRASDVEVFVPVAEILAKVENAPADAG